MQRVILEVTFGPLQGTKRVLKPGETLRVGRRERADLVVPDDRLMSAPHFEITWDGEKCTLRDLGSKKGTLVGGKAVTEAELSNASWIRAGGSDFLVFFEGATPPGSTYHEDLCAMDLEDLQPNQARWLEANRDRLVGEAAKRGKRASEALSQLKAAERPLFAMLDAARDDRILTVIRESVEVYRSLYEGVDGDALAHVAPYLVALPKGARLLDRLVEEGWEKRWGSFIESDRPFVEVRRHLRRFLMVADEETRERFYFRFYDPVVLRTFLETATVRQKSELFGPIAAFYFEGEGGECLREAREARIGGAS